MVAREWKDAGGHVRHIWSDCWHHNGNLRARSSQLCQRQHDVLEQSWSFRCDVFRLDSLRDDNGQGGYEYQGDQTLHRDQVEGEKQR